MLLEDTLLDAPESKSESERGPNQENILALGRLTAGIIHEINTPVQYITDNLNFLSDQFAVLDSLLVPFSDAVENLDADELRKIISAADAEFLREELPIAIDETKAGIFHVAKLVAAVRAFSHPGTNRRAVIVNEGIELMIAISRNEWKRCATIDTDLSTSLPAVYGSESQLSQVWLNLITNSAQAIAEQCEAYGQIMIATRVQDGRVVVSVKDNGPGMSEAVRAQAFDRFYTTKPKGEGTGQGLAISREIVEEHGGEILVNSSPGTGTEFIVCLPADQRES